MSYQDTLLTWHDFYLACAAASATFAGLLFVALSLHLRIVVTHPEARSLARITLTDYFAVLLVSLFLLTPAGVPQQTGIDLMVISGVSLALITPPSVRGIRARRARTLGLGTADFEIRAEHARMHCGRCNRRCLLLGPYVDRLQRPCGDSSGIARRRRAEYVGPAGDRRRQEAMKLTGKFGAAEDLQR